jgi:hypothetical protein
MSDATASLNLTPDQLALIERPLDAKVFLEGPAGCGKTTVGVERLLYLMAQGVPGDEILLFAPQRTLTQPYLQALRTPGVSAGGMVTMLTLGGLARRMVDLFWPLVAEQAGFARPNDPPIFLTLETAQYYMAHLVRPLFDQGFFETLVIDHNRLYSQILDNLNKAAVVGFPHTEIASRLKSGWIGDPGQAHVYEDAQECASRFRTYCLEHNLLDFSLQVEIFRRLLWPLPLCRGYLIGSYRHLIVDNLEEDTPVAHDLLGEWLPAFDSALLIYDREAGYRRFLGADPLTARELADLCQETAVLERSFVTSPDVHALELNLAQILPSEGEPEQPAKTPEEGDPGAALKYDLQDYFPEMLDWVADEAARLVHEASVPPGEIVILAPYISDALRFSLMDRLARHDLPVRTHRPSRSLRDQPVTQCLLTLAALAHPEWGLPPARYDVAYALMQAIQDMDLVRAQLLAEIVYRGRLVEGEPPLSSFERIVPETQERITYLLGQRYETLRLWIAEYSQGPREEFDHFLSRLFGELLSQPGYGFYGRYQAGEVTANLVESVQKFRWAAGEALAEEGIPLGQEYLSMVRDGVIAAQYIRSWQVEADESILLAPAYTFIMSNRPVDVQFWLNVGGRGWFERLYQPLTHPYVLSRQWPVGQPWTDENEHAVSQASLRRLALGLARRCRRGVYLGLSDLSEQGYEQRGPFLRAFQRLLRRIAREG